ncbi:hypothetical protein LX32DRAFT_218237 [Colletotrichum zoysiae]|uniref:Uncharacterized protein n=1 Tax=Colletotrichum zoysiae TaxID=1216348 RepID=A0AAD9HN38_9PEZI|nr:hypothetical protein LX32DRAFT_218237 [Colletotrichum zoysiae]
MRWMGLCNYIGIVTLVWGRVIAGVAGWGTLLHYILQGTGTNYYQAWAQVRWTKRCKTDGIGRRNGRRNGKTVRKGKCR